MKDLRDLTEEELNKRFLNHRPSDKGIESIEDIRLIAKNFALMVDTLCETSREKSLAFTHIEQAMFWANAAIARREKK